MPHYRSIFSLKTNGSGALIPINTPVEGPGGSMYAYLTTRTQDINTTSETNTLTLYTLNVPTGIQVEVVGYTLGGEGSGTILTSPTNETNVAVSSNSTAPAYDIYDSGSTANPYHFEHLVTNTSGQIGVRANGTGGTLYEVTRGWIDFRRN